MADVTEQILNFDVGGIGSTFMDSASAFGGYLVWIFVISAVVVAFVYILSFKHIVSVRILNRNGNVLPVKDRAREVKVDGVKYWKLLKRKDVIPVPPADALIVVKSGGKPKFYAEFTYNEESGYIPLEYDVTTSNFNEKLIITQHGKVIKDSFQPFTTNQRSLYVMQLRKAEARKKKDLLERIMQLATPLVLVMLFIAVLIFWEDVAKPGKEMANLNVQMQQKNLELLDNLAEISAQNARIVQAYTGTDLEITQQVTQ